ncbi:UvrD-helicase domain-containing protein [Arthrobacter sp. AL12]|uniref:UvrD-helicase domain-containing protein n=1 Tax=Arthrobacter sp. AL12 TaxID=3042241 RepID=UPI00249AF08B|nr:UvrD-helicase domain-containing protein [Arthrobacter sp. AL12]MDI3213226.1 AAA family ATPase [Arthrobacter sp. AL12]
MLAEIKLDESQRAVAEAEPDARMFVTAAAGQGKTEVLLARVKTLVEDGLNPADEILVLSFSRAAVEAVRKRARIHDLDGLQIRTFDSFAAQILIDMDEETLGDSFDARIRKATKYIAGDETPDRVTYLKHILVDEAQDLVGDRAELVMALFSALGDDLGFTVLGDPLQGIYDFQLEESESKLTSAELIETLVKEFDADQLTLAKHYRAVTDRTRELISVGDEIRHLGALDESACEAAHSLLDDFRREVSSTSVLNESGALSPNDGDTTALLCSTNYEVLIASELLWENGYPHLIRRKAQDMSVAPWVHQVFKDLEDRTYDAGEIKSRLNDLFGEAAADRWLALKTAEGNFSAYDSLNVPQLSQRLRSRSIPLTLTVADVAPLIVSTVHRAKGLEFTNVLYLQPPSGGPAAKINADTLKQKYVALSRAREEIISTKLPKNLLKRMDSANGRWLEKAYGKNGLYTDRMEFANSDIDDVSPYYPSTGDAQAVQKHLVLDELLGEIVSGTLQGDEPGPGEVPRYVLATRDGRVIGRTSQSFGYDFKRSFGFKYSRNWRWPAGFTGARVTSIECATGHPEETRLSGLGASGMWLVPRLTGLIRQIRD